jgi:hypothetical protein
MNKIQSSKLNSLLSVQTLLGANPTIVATIVALDEAADELTDLITGINTHVKVQSSPSGAAEAKEDALIKLGDTAFEVGGGVLSFAEKTGDLTLAARVRFSRSVITAGKNNLVVARCQGIVDAATENLASLGNFGVTQAKLTTLKQRLKTYDGLRVMPRQAQGAAAAATRQLEQLFPETDRLLANRMDRLVWQFRESEPEFYEKYQVARTVVNGATTGAEEVATPTIVATPVVTPSTKAA